MKTMPEDIRPFSDLLQKALADACTSCADDHEASVGLPEDGKHAFVVHSVGDDAATMHLPLLPGLGRGEVFWLIHHWIQKRHSAQLHQALRERDEAVQRLTAVWDAFHPSPGTGFEFTSAWADEAERSGRTAWLDDMSTADALAWLVWCARNGWDPGR